MNKKVKIALIVVAILLVLVILYKITKLRKSSDTGNPATDGEILSRGSTGNNVKLLQMKLNDLLRQTLIANIDVYAMLNGEDKIKLREQLNTDGNFGPITEMYLLAFTGKNSINSNEINTLTVQLPS